MFYLYEDVLVKCVIHIGDDGTVTGIPHDEKNRDYQTFLAWVAAGNTPTEWTPE